MIYGYLALLSAVTPRASPAHRRNGAQFSHPERMTWNGKNPGTWHWYRKDFRRDNLQVA
jgi:hypothetical protein